MTAEQPNSGTAPPPGWEGILDKDETVLWQGRPDARVAFRIDKAFQFIFGLFFAGFALFWMVMASQAGGVFWMFGLIHFGAGLAISFGAIFWDAYRRRYTWYTLTDRRAFIATNMPHKGRKLQSYPITPGTPLEFSPGPLATITFASEERRGNKGRRYTVPVGFERIPDGDAVYRHLRRVQEGRRDAE